MGRDGVENDVEEGDRGVLVHVEMVKKIVRMVLVGGGAHVVSESSGSHHGGHLYDLAVLSTAAPSPSGLPWYFSGRVGVPLPGGGFEGAAEYSGSWEPG